MRRKHRVNNIFQPVIVVLEDITSFPQGNWKLGDLKPIELRVVGFLWVKDKKKIVLKRVKNHYEDEPFVIPIGCVKKIIYLKGDVKNAKTI